MNFQIHRILGGLVAVAIFAFSVIPAQAQDDKQAEQEKKKDAQPKYEFTIDVQIEATEVKSQGSTGTCWCFASASFLESELMRRSKGNYNLSEMFIVKNVYRDKAQNFVLRQGKANFSQGALAHDFINAVERHGLMPEEVYDGLEEGVTRHDHGEMEVVLKGMLDAVIKRPKPSPKWMNAFGKVMDTYLGSSPETFVHEGRSVTPQEFAAAVDFRAEDYINITSYNHHPFYKEFVLEIPDNFSNGSFYNVPIEELMEIIEHAVTNGYTVAWDGDVSERGFSAANGLAVLPVKEEQSKAMKQPVKEIEVDQDMRQDTFYNYVTTDDHLMHLTGMATDQNGTKYFIIKNSWGEIGKRKGYLYMSENYARLKTVSILVHKDGLPPRLRK